MHPDINPGDREAEARFRQVLDAYETLMDPDRRRRYDAGQLSSAEADDEAETFGFAGFDFSSRVHAERTTTFGELFEEVLSKRAGRPGEGAEHGADIHARTLLTFEEAWHGVQRTVTVTRQDVCRSCAGSGFQRVAETRCVSCEGTGAVRSVRGHMVFAKTCPTCGGEGRLKQEECVPCHGQGVEPRSETLTVRIPPAVADGARVRIAAKGHAGVRGGVPGDLLIDVSVAEHPVFRREGDELHMTVPIAIHEAALGAKIDIDTPDGSVRLRVPPGTQSGQRFRLRDRGFPARHNGQTRRSRGRGADAAAEGPRRTIEGITARIRPNQRRERQARAMTKRQGKAYFMISVVAQRYNIHPQTLRLYEREGLLKPSRTEGNTRLYSEEDLEQLETILALTRDLGVNLAGVEIILNMRRKMEQMQGEVNEFMEYVKRELARGIDDWEQRLGTALVKASPTDLVRASHSGRMRPSQKVLNLRRNRAARDCDPMIRFARGQEVRVARI